MRYRRSIVNQQNAENSQQIDLTPMLDVVFIMLIFFIVTATFVKEAGVDVVRPAADTLESIKNQKIFIAISADNEIWIDKQVLKPVSVRGAIERLRAENSKGSVVIQADANSNAGAFAGLADAVADELADLISDFPFNKTLMHPLAPSLANSFSVISAQRPFDTGQNSQRSSVRKCTCCTLMSTYRSCMGRELTSRRKPTQSSRPAPNSG